MKKQEIIDIIEKRWGNNVIISGWDNGFRCRVTTLPLANGTVISLLCTPIIVPYDGGETDFWLIGDDLALTRELELAGIDSDKIEAAFEKHQITTTLDKEVMIKICKAKDVKNSIKSMLDDARYIYNCLTDKQ